MRDLTPTKGTPLSMFKPRSLVSKLAGRTRLALLAAVVVVLAVAVPVIAAPSTGETGNPTGSGANGGEATLVVTKPTGLAVGDVMIANVGFRGASTVSVTPPTDWVQIFKRTNTGTNLLTQGTYYK